MKELLSLLGAILLFAVAHWSVSYETKQKNINNNDERWQAVTSHANNLTFIIILGLAVFLYGLVILSDIRFFYRFDIVANLLTDKNKLQGLHTIVKLAPFLMLGIRLTAMKYYDRRM